MKRISFGMMLMFTALFFNGCDTGVNSQTPSTLEGKWRGTDTLGSPVLVTIGGTTMTLESGTSKSKGTYENKNGTIVYQVTHIYYTDKFVAVETYMEKMKQEYLDLLQSSFKSGCITEEKYKEDAALAETLFPVPGPETVSYTLNENTLRLSMTEGNFVLTRM